MEEEIKPGELTKEEIDKWVREAGDGTFIVKEIHNTIELKQDTFRVCMEFLIELSALAKVNLIRDDQCTYHTTSNNFGLYYNWEYELYRLPTESAKYKLLELYKGMRLLVNTPIDRYQNRIEASSEEECNTILATHTDLLTSANYLQLIDSVINFLKNK